MLERLLSTKGVTNVLYKSAKIMILLSNFSLYSPDSFYSINPFGGDDQWHKIGLSFKKDKLVAYLDCREVNELDLKNKVKIKTDGQLSIGGAYPDGSTAFRVSTCSFCIDLRRRFRTKLSPIS